MILLNRISKYYGSQDVLKDISLRIMRGQKIGLIGPNGCGKTTLIRLLLGEEEASSGKVVRERGLRLGYVPQRIRFSEQETVRDVLLADYDRLEKELRKAEYRLADIGLQQLEAVLSVYQKARDAYDAIGGDNLPQKAVSILDSLGLPDSLDRRVATLSGGEQNVLSLARALIFEPDMLVLDEPGNHLDYLGLAWLEKYLLDYRGTVLIVSHNRYLLDRVTEKILELENMRITEYEGNYSTYRMNKLKALIALRDDYTANQKKLKQLEELVRRFASIARNSRDSKWGKRLRARKSQLARARRSAVPKPELNNLSISPRMEIEETRADLALCVKSYSQSFGDLKLFENAELDLACGEKVALVGPNGSGKTTFLKAIVREASWDNPVLRIGPSLKIGYCAQNQETFNPAATILDEFRSLGPYTKRDLFTVLSGFLFAWEEMDKKIEYLSGGEKNRLQLARLSLLGANFLLLDEPTNHMDIRSREAIEDSLTCFKGTILIVSHDRYFLEKIADRIVEIRDRKFLPFPGRFSEFWAAREASAMQISGKVSARGRTRQRAAARSNREAPVKTDKRDASVIESHLSELEEQRIKTERELTLAFTSGDNQRAKKLSAALKKISSRIDNLYQEWEQYDGF